jgi:hypothetical protein
MKRFALVAAILAVLTSCVAGASDDDLPRRPPSTMTFEGTDGVLHVEIAQTDAARRRGLMGVESLPANEGMAFLFEEPVGSTFWMKDTVIPLSIAFVDEGGRVVGVRDMEPCEADPCPTYGVDEPYLLAVEANIGWFDAHGVEVGDRAHLSVSAYA